MRFDKIAVLDFGGQYAHLIATKVRSLKVLCEIKDPQDSLESFREYRGIILSGLRYMPVWLEAWEKSGVTITPGFAPVLDALENKDVAGALANLQRVWGEQEGMLALYLEHREAEAAKSKKRGPKRR